MLRCLKCGAMNRVPAEKLRQGLKPVCGRCRNPLALDDRPITITDANFAEQIERSPVPVLLDLWAPWCGPCRMIAPAIEELAAEMAGRLRVGKLNVDENPATAERFQVRGIPALLIFRDGREIDRIVGAQPKSAIAQRLEQILA
jgi:thioredoxin 2